MLLGHYKNRHWHEGIRPSAVQEADVVMGHVALQHGGCESGVEDVEGFQHRRSGAFIVLCLVLVRGAEGSKEDLQLDGSLEFYFMILLCIVAAVAECEGLKIMAASVYGWWIGCLKKKKRLERLRNRAQAAVQEELQRPRTPIPTDGGAASSATASQRARQQTPTRGPRRAVDRCVSATSMTMF